MNEIARPQISASDVTPVSMMFDPVIADRVRAIAETMAKGRVSIPDHLRGNPGDCLAIVMQAAAWRLNPFTVAQKTYMIHGRLSYEAQLVNAVVSSLGLLDGRFSYEYVGNWRKLAKRPKIAKSSKGHDIPTPGWREQDEEGLSLIVRAKLRGDPEVKEHELFLASVWPRNSTLWATAPQQQAAYLGTKQWVRRYAPDAILGVYTPDEVQEMQIVEGERIDTAPQTDVAARIQREARLAAPETEASFATNEEWPQEINGEIVDCDMVIYDERIHSGSRTCTNTGHWRRRRGVSDEVIKKLERRVSDEEPAIEDDSLSEEESEIPEAFSEAWFNVGISECETEMQLAEYKEVLGDAGFDQEQFDGISAKIAARRAEIRAMGEN